MKDCIEHDVLLRKGCDVKKLKTTSNKFGDATSAEAHVTRLFWERGPLSSALHTWTSTMLILL